MATIARGHELGFKSNQVSEFGLQTTGIGSLPHHNLDSALDYSFKHDIPYLPQIPMRNPWEYMIPQALEGLPGLRVERDGHVQINLAIWSGRAKEFSGRLKDSAQDLAQFEPTSAASSAWQSFVWELAERKAAVAKVQIAGPVTSQLALRVPREPELSHQIFSLILLRAQAMVKRIQSLGIKPILFIDEPALIAQSSLSALGFRELALMVSAVKKLGAIVGIHCCSETRWDLLEQTDVDYISLDTQLSLETLLGAEGFRTTEAFLARGGRFSLGVIPTSVRSLAEGDRSSSAASIDHGTQSHLIQQVSQSLLSPHAKRLILEESLLTPACGLALLDPERAEAIYTSLCFERERLRNLRTANLDRSPGVPQA